MRLNKFVGRAIVVTLLNLGLVTTFGPSSAQAQAGYSKTFQFLKAIKKVDYREIKMIVEGGVNINTRDYDDRATPLVIAARMKEAPLVHYLLKNGAKPNLYGNDGRTALMIAAGNGDKLMVRVLLKAGADMDQGDNNGTTPLIAAVLSKRDQVVKLLLDAGADHTLEDYTGRSALQHAIDTRLRRTQKLLKDAGATR